ncbi:MAG: hypothetical protein JSS66_12050 [Armatimonadetes bacterium]|nr:hypothetical protein [Armatimonadota bacterium]
MASGPALRLTLFGEFKAANTKGDLVVFSNRKVALLCAYLGLRAGSSIDRTVVARSVWPDADPQAALASLRNGLNLLRRDLAASEIDPDGVLRSDKTHISFGENVLSDRSEFGRSSKRLDLATSPEQALSALPSLFEVLTDELLKGVDLEWAEGERSKVEQTILKALSLVAESPASVPPGCEPFSLALQAAAALPQSEPVLQAALRVALATGKGAEGVKLYRKFERNLRERLSMAPAEATIQLAREARKAGSGRELPPSNLPAAHTQFFGRASELGAIDKWYGTVSPGARLLTLLGTGGIGKTRLALEAGDRLAEQYQAHVWFLELDSITEASEIVPRLIETIGFGEDAPHTVAHLAASIGSRPVLLVMDNLEQIAMGLGAIVLELLQACPGLRILATSRVPIGIPGEQTLRVPPLPLPASAGETMRSASVRLFLDRAKHINPQIQDTEPHLLADLVTKLEGLPLALCLAAAQTDLLTVKEILKGLEDRFQVLVSEHPDLPERHQRLWSCIDWSYRMQPEAHRLLKVLAAFRGGWTLKLAQWACPGENVRGALTGLLRASLVHEVGRSDTVRFSMFESIREFAEAQCTTAEWEDCQAAHAHAIAEWFREAQHVSRSFNSGYIAERVSEYENFRRAFEWALQNEPKLALEIANGLAYYWFSRDMHAEGRTWLERAISAVPDVPGEETAMARRALATMLTGLSHYEESFAQLERGLLLLPDDTDPVQRARFLNSMGNVILNFNPSEAIRHFEAAVELCHDAIEADPDVWNRIVASFEGNAGFAHYLAGNLDEAERMINEVVERLKNGGNDDWLAYFTHNSGLVAMVKGDLAEAERRFVRARGIIEPFGLNPATRGWLSEEAVVVTRQGRLSDALQLLKQGAEGIRSARGQEQYAECFEAMAECCEAAGEYEEAVALLSSLKRLDRPRQRSAADDSPTPESRLSSLRERLNPERFKAATARYRDLLPSEILQEIEEFEPTRLANRSA